MINILVTAMKEENHMIAGIKDGMGWAFGREIFDA